MQVASLCILIVMYLACVCAIFAELIEPRIQRAIKRHGWKRLLGASVTGTGHVLARKAGVAVSRAVRRARRKVWFVDGTFVTATGERKQLGQRVKALDPDSAIAWCRAEWRSRGFSRVLIDHCRVVHQFTTAPSA